MNDNEEILSTILDKLSPFVESRILTLAEPEKQNFYVRNSHLAPVTKMLRRAAHDSVHRFKTPKGRDTFLWAVLRHLEKVKGREWLVVGLGKRIGNVRSRPCRIEGMWVGHGTKGQVSLTELARQLVDQQVERVRNGEVIIIHNHLSNPIKWILSQMIGWTPLPSAIDRRTAFSAHLSTLKNFANRGHRGYFRFYLVDEGKLREFFLPPLESITNLFSLGAQ